MIELRCTVRGCGATMPAVAARPAAAGGRPRRRRCCAAPAGTASTSRAAATSTCCSRRTGARGTRATRPRRSRRAGGCSTPASAPPCWRRWRRRSPPSACRRGRARSTSARGRVRSSAPSPLRFDLEAAGVDLSARAADLAARRHPGVLWLVANADRGLPFADGSLDLILSITARRSPAECARVLAPGGRLVVALPASDDLRSCAKRSSAAPRARSGRRSSSRNTPDTSGSLERRAARERRAFSAAQLEDLLVCHLPRRPGRAPRAGERSRRPRGHAEPRNCRLRAVAAAGGESRRLHRAAALEVARLTARGTPARY